jgi:NAD(P)-dependent dehydrogenase (short-subunit alcohol dehydrogenase family)
MDIDGHTALVAGAAIGAVAVPRRDARAVDATLTVNLLARMRATQLALPAMRDAGAGAIVNIASSAARGPGAHRGRRSPRSPNR